MVTDELFSVLASYDLYTLHMGDERPALHSRPVVLTLLIQFRRQLALSNLRLPGSKFTPNKIVIVTYILVQYKSYFLSHLISEALHARLTRY